MKKISYRSSPVVVIEPANDPCLITPPGAEEGLSGDMSGEGGVGIGRGLVAPGEGTLPPTFKADEMALPEYEKKRRVKRKVNYDDLLSMLTNIADDLDDGVFRKDSELTDFADFMIKKIADQKSMDYSNLFKDAIVRLAKSDIIGVNEIILIAVRTYSRSLVIEYRSSGDMEQARTNAYQRAMGKIDEALSTNG